LSANEKRNLVLVPRSRNLPLGLMGFSREPLEERPVVVGPLPGRSAEVRGVGDLYYTYSTDAGMRRLAYGCFYLLVGKALLSFPTTSVSHPSEYVQVDRNASMAIPSNHARYFPFSVEQKKWHRGVVPVLKDPNFNMSLPKNKSLINTDLDTLIGYIEKALIDQFREERFLT